ncbi:hypothetical protein ACHAXR_008683 [Thalassiosira sp. AJA248-18]
MTSSATTIWRSPLSILMGARANDDADLELREDYSYRRSPAAAPASPAVDSKSVDQSRILSYIPFNSFGLTSPAPASAHERRSGAGSSNENIQLNGSPVHPPQGAFPPPISGSSTGQRGNEHGDDDEEREQRGTDHQFIASHPWFNQLQLTELNDENNQSTQPNNENNETKADATKKFISWRDQKAIISTTVNFCNSIIGAGAMGLGGAFAASGGGISIVMLILFAFLTKLSLDLVVDLSSCPSIIKKARSDDRDGNHSQNDSPDGISLSGSESLSGGSESDDPSNKNNPFEDILDTMEESNNAGNDQTDEGDNPSNSKTGEESLQKEANNGSPLMAQEDETNEISDAFQTPINNAGLKIDHPLVPSNDSVNQKLRYDDHLTMDVTAPRRFSPLDLAAEDIPVAKSKSMPSIHNNNHVQQPYRAMPPCTYEELGRAAFGTTGRLAVLISKALYSCGCLIAYVVVVRDNFGLALRRIIVGPTSPNFVSNENEDNGWLYDDVFLAFWVSALFMLPLSCPRTMKPLAKFSFISILSIIFLILVVVYLFFTCTNPDGSVTGNASFYENWIQIRSFSGFVESLGCFVFTFVCHHTVNLAYESLPMQIRNPKIWRRVSTNAISLALQSSLAIGIFAYLTFGSQTPADVFLTDRNKINHTQLMGYPADLTLANIARLLLCLTMVLTFPLPFLTCREMCILIFLDMHKFYHANDLERFNIFRICRGKLSRTTPVQRETADETEFVQMQLPSFFRRWKRKRRGFSRNVGFGDPNEEWWNEINGNGNGAVTQALLSEEEHETAIITSIGGQKGKGINPSPLSSRSGDPSSSETTISSVLIPTPSWILPNHGDGRQLSLLWHTALTFTLWLSVTAAGCWSPSLGDVLDLVGAFTGTLLAFVLPALFSFKLKGYSHLSMAILGIGGVVGLLGTIFSFVKFTRDMS